MSTDLLMQETGNGGDLVLKGNNLTLARAFQNMPYLGMFGGNVEQSTTGPKQPGEQALDFWGNYLLMSQQPELQFNSDFERALYNTALSSAGRLQLERAVKEDINFMTVFSVLTISASIDDADRIRVYIQIQEPDNLQSTEFIYIWDNAKQELTTE